MEEEAEEADPTAEEAGVLQEDATQRKIIASNRKMKRNFIPPL